MQELRIKYGKILEETHLAFNEGAQVVVHKGGTGSGKTFELIIYLLLIEAQSGKGKIITIVSESYPHLKIGVMRYAQTILMQTNLIDKVTWTKSDNSIIFPNGNIVEFFSADRIEKALGARRYMLYANEVNSLKLEVFEELARRSEKVIMDFNPIAQFWLEDKFLPYYEPYKIITSNYLDNVCPPETEVQRIEKRAALDPNFKRIHIDCEYGVYDGLIFPNIILIDEMPELPTSYGLDFGYTNDPTALIECAEDGKGYYFNEIIYQTGLQNNVIAELWKSKGLHGAIYADSANPKDIDDLYLRGLNVQGVIGGKKTIMYGIDLMLQKPIHITKRSVELIKEFRSYMYATDKNGLKINYPVDINNHGIDAVRYNIVSRQELRREYRVLPRTNVNQF